LFVPSVSNLNWSYIDPHTPKPTISSLH